jgi:hypothetical protein
MRITVASRDGIPPFQPEVIAFEMDVDQILRLDREPSLPEQSADELIEKMEQPARHRVGDVIWLGGDSDAPVYALLMVHDLDSDPSWDEDGISAALSNLMDESAARGAGRLALPVIGTVHGRLDPDRFPTLLHAALVRAVDPPEEIWVMAEDAALVSRLRPMLEETQ